jgi:carbon-monoxide dehydrogenase large subunit
VTPHKEASVVDALASFGVVHADMPLTLANIWLAMQGRPARRELPASAST